MGMSANESREHGAHQWAGVLSALSPPNPPEQQESLSRAGGRAWTPPEGLKAHSPLRRLPLLVSRETVRSAERTRRQGSGVPGTVGGRWSRADQYLAEPASPGRTAEPMRAATTE